MKAAPWEIKTQFTNSVFSPWREGQCAHQQRIHLSAFHYGTTFLMPVPLTYLTHPNTKTAIRSTLLYSGTSWHFIATLYQDQFLWVNLYPILQHLKDWNLNASKILSPNFKMQRSWILYYTLPLYHGAIMIQFISIILNSWCTVHHSATTLLFFCLWWINEDKLILPLRGFDEFVKI